MKVRWGKEVPSVLFFLSDMTMPYILNRVSSVYHGENYKKIMNIVLIRRLFLPCFLASVLIYNTGCACSAYKELNTKNEELRNINLELRLKEKTITELLDRLSMKDQEIGKLTDELHSASATIEDLKSDIEKLREIDVQVEEKKKEVDNSIVETIPVTVPEGTLKTEPTTTEEQNSNQQF